MRGSEKTRDMLSRGAGRSVRGRGDKPYARHGPLWEFTGADALDKARVSGPKADKLNHEKVHTPWRRLKSLETAAHPHDSLCSLGYRIIRRASVNVQQNTPEWMEARAECYFTASAASAMYGGGAYNGSRGPVRFLDTRHNYPEQRVHVDSVQTLRGHLVEPYVRDAMRGMRARTSDPQAEPWVDLEMDDGGFSWIEVTRVSGPDIATLWTHPTTGEPWPMRIGASVDVRVFATDEGGSTRREVASGEIKVPFNDMYDPAKSHVHPVHENDNVFAGASKYDPASKQGFLDTVALPSKLEYSAQQIIQMAVQGVPASLHVVYYPGDPKKPTERKGYAVANVLHFSPGLFDLVVTCAARMRYIEAVMSAKAMHTAVCAGSLYGEAKARFDAAAVREGAPSPARGGWTPAMAFEGSYAFPVPRSLWAKIAREVRGAPLYRFLNDEEQRIDPGLARRTGMPKEAVVLAGARGDTNNLFLPSAMHQVGWPALTGTFHKHVRLLHDTERADPEFWRLVLAPSFVAPPAREEDGPWIDDMPPPMPAPPLTSEQDDTEFWDAVGIAVDAAASVC